MGNGRAQLMGHQGTIHLATFQGASWLSGAPKDLLRNLYGPSGELLGEQELLSTFDGASRDLLGSL